MDSSDIECFSYSDIDDDEDFTPSELGIDDDTLFEKTEIDKPESKFYNLMNKAYFDKLHEIDNVFTSELEKSPYLNSDQIDKIISRWDWCHNEFIEGINKQKKTFIEKFKKIQNRPNKDWRKVKLIPLCYEKFVEAYGKPWNESKYSKMGIEYRYNKYNKINEFNRELYKDYLNYDLEAIKDKKRLGLYGHLSKYMKHLDK